MSKIRKLERVWDEEARSLDAEAKREKKELTKLQKLKQIVGKRTSEGYTPNPNEEVELRGD